MTELQIILVIFLTDHDPSHHDDHAPDLHVGDLHVADDQEVVKNYPSWYKNLSQSLSMCKWKLSSHFV